MTTKLRSMACAAMACLLMAAWCGPALAISKCTLSDGKVVFQDTPCAGAGNVLNVRPASGHSATPMASAPSASASAPEKPQTPAQRMEAQAAALNAKRRIQDFEQVSIPNANRDIQNQRRQCDRQIKELTDRKLSANNNLAGATWETSISQEMSAVATRCDTVDRQLKEALDALRKDCQALGGCK